MKIPKQRLRHIRIRFLAMGMLLFMVFGFLIAQIQNQEKSRLIQEHREIAERLFDELEGEFFRFVKQEEGRDALQWSTLTKETPADDFVDSYFQLTEEEQVSNNPSSDAPYVNRALEERLVEQKAQTYQNSIPQDTQSARKMLNRSSKKFALKKGKEKTSKPFQSFTEREKTVLFREVVVDGVVAKQGLIIDTQKFQETISERVLVDIRPTEYSDMRSDRSLDIRNTEDWAVIYWQTHSSDGAAYVFRHLFSVPFAQFHAEAHIKPLSLGTSRLLSSTSLGLLSMLFIAAGLWSLYQMQCVTEETARLRSDFVGAVSHELRTPITAIQLYSQMLSEGMVSPQKEKEYYKTIDDEAGRLATLVEDILSFSKIDKGNQDRVFPNGAFSDVVDSIRSRFSLFLEQEGFSFSMEASPEALSFRVPVEASIQVISNLIDNARKFSDEQKDIVLVARVKDDSLHVSVFDKGPGIPIAHQKQVLSPFVRGEDEQTRKTKGTGIGLALVVGLMNAMCGDFLIENRREGGLCATAIWPLFKES